MTDSVIPPLVAAATPADEAQARVDHLVQHVLPGLLVHDVDIGRYGPPSLSERSAEPDWLGGDASALASLLALLMQRLQEDSPEMLTQRASWWQRLTGIDVERRVENERRHGSLADIAGRIGAQAEAVRATVLQMDALRIAQQQQIADLKDYVEAGKAFAAALPIDTTTVVLADPPRDRLLRRVGNLATLLATLEIGQMQLQLARGNALDVLDRGNEVLQVLLPMWQQNRRALYTARSADPKVIGAAREAHQALLQSLQQIIAGPVPVVPHGSETPGR